MSDHGPLDDANRFSQEYIDNLRDRPVWPDTTVEELRALLDHELAEDGMDPRTVIAELVKGADPGIVGIPSPRYFGFVIGGRSEVSIAADWLTSTWDQNSGLFVGGPSAAVVEEVAGRWLKELLDVPSNASFAFVTGTQMAHFTALAAARHHVLAAAEWDVEKQGLQGSPSVTVIASAEHHVTVSRALRYLGFGSEAITQVPCDEQGRAIEKEMIEAIDRASGPTIVCLQAGNVNSGSFDPISQVVDAAHAKGAWVHLDGAFGLWAAASPKYAHLLEGSNRVDSWSTDAHKWLNVPYDNAIAFVAHPESHNKAIGVHASYLIHSEGHRERDEMDWTPEFSRRARGFTVYAQLRALGRGGVRDLVEKLCGHAQRFAERLGAEEGVEILNDVVLNQVLVRFSAPSRNSDELTQRTIKRIQDEGTLWLSGTQWQERGAMRISVSNADTTTDDVDLSVDAILRAFREESRSSS